MKPEICCSTVCYSHLPVSEALRKISAVGFRSLELLAIKGWVHVDVEEISPKEIEELCSEYGLSLVALHAGGLDASTDESLSKSSAYIRSVIDCAKELNVDRVVFTGGRRTEGALDRFVAGLEKLAQYAEDRKVKIFIENHYQNQIETVEDMKRIMQAIQSPYVGLTVDTGHFTASRVPLSKVLQELGPWIRHVHVKDHVGTQSVGLGRGETDNEGFVKGLKRLGYAGYLSMELEVEDRENIDLYMQEGYQYMERLLSLFI